MTRSRRNEDVERIILWNFFLPFQAQLWNFPQGKLNTLKCSPSPSWAAWLSCPQQILCKYAASFYLYFWTGSHWQIRCFPSPKEIQYITFLNRKQGQWTLPEPKPEQDYWKTGPRISILSGTPHVYRSTWQEPQPPEQTAWWGWSLLSSYGMIKLSSGIIESGDGGTHMEVLPTALPDANQTFACSVTRSLEEVVSAFSWTCSQCYYDSGPGKVEWCYKCI